MKKLLLFLSLSFSLLSVGVSADSLDKLNIPKQPPSSGVYDPNDYLNDQVESRIVEMNKSYMNTKQQPQLAVVVLKTLGEYGDEQSIKPLANDIARTWKPGTSTTNNGAVLVIGIDDRVIRLETSNMLSTVITDYEASELNDVIKDDFRNNDYSGGLNKYLDLYQDKLKDYANLSTAEIKEKQEEDAKLAAMFFNGFFVIMGALSLTMSGYFGLKGYMQRKTQKKDRLKRSQYDYAADDKLYPDDFYFISNESWTDQRITAYKKQKAEIQRRREEDYIRRSHIMYEGKDKLYPNDANFRNPNHKNWSKVELDTFFYNDKLKRSDYNYKGSDKLYPNDSSFIENATWTALLIDEYLDEYRRSQAESHYDDDDDDFWGSSSGGFTGGWSGGGFDGGGASGSW